MEIVKPVKTISSKTSIRLVLEYSFGTTISQLNKGKVNLDRRTYN